MARTNPGLTEEQLAKLRTALAGPRKPRVSLLDTQFGADATGQVVSIGDPETDGADFITVRVKLGGVSDTLTFGPGELAVPTRGRPKSAAAKSAAAGRTAARSLPAKSASSSAAPSTAGVPSPPAASSTPAASPTPATSSTPAAPATPKAASTPTRSPRSRKAAGKRRTPAPVTITVSSTGNSWHLTAMRSGRSLVKATPLAPGVVTAAADLFGDPALQQAVSEINDVSLTEAEERARQLREELAQIESLLKSHQRPGAKRGR